MVIYIERFYNKALLSHGEQTFVRYIENIICGTYYRSSTVSDSMTVDEEFWYDIYDILYWKSTFHFFEHIGYQTDLHWLFNQMIQFREP